MSGARVHRTLFVVACALLDADGRVLMAQRPIRSKSGGKWEFPGGKIEVNETPEEALQRELREELSVEPCLSCFEPLGFASQRGPCEPICLMLYACRRWDGFPSPMDGQKLRWLKPDQIRGLDLCPLDRYLVDTVGDRIRGARVS
jgi:8-oxo-dGTP diphosphatase